MYIVYTLQFIGVLSGGMSIAGKRPPTVPEDRQYGENYKRKLVSELGITRLWQVGAISNITNFDKIVYLIDN